MLFLTTNYQKIFFQLHSTVVDIFQAFTGKYDYAHDNNLKGQEFAFPVLGTDDNHKTLTSTLYGVSLSTNVFLQSPFSSSIFALLLDIFLRVIYTHSHFLNFNYILRQFELLRQFIHGCLPCYPQLTFTHQLFDSTFLFIYGQKININYIIFNVYLFLPQRSKSYLHSSPVMTRSMFFIPYYKPTVRIDASTQHEFKLIAPEMN